MYLLRICKYDFKIKISNTNIKFCWPNLSIKAIYNYGKCYDNLFNLILKCNFTFPVVNDKLLFLLLFVVQTRNISSLKQITSTTLIKPVTFLIYICSKLIKVTCFICIEY